MTKVGVKPIQISDAPEEHSVSAVLDTGQANNKKILINISGQLFVSTLDTLLKYPTSKLGKLVSSQPTCTEYFFESDADIFKEILKFYLNDELHCPRNVCFKDFEAHLHFWEIDVKHLSDCCAQEMNEDAELESQFEFFNKCIIPQKSRANGCYAKSYLIWCFLTDPYGPNTKWKIGSKIWAVGYLLLTLFIGTTTAVSTLPSIFNTDDNSTDYERQRFLSPKMSCEEYVNRWLKLLPLIISQLYFFSFAVFFMEIWVRFLTCPDKVKFWKSINGMDMTISLFELVANCISWFVMHYVIPNKEQFKNSSALCYTSLLCQLFTVVIVQMRYLRLLSYASVYSGLKVLLITLYRSWKEILLLVVLLALSVLILGPLVYFSVITSLGNGQALNSVPAAYWFVIVTMTTVGYGDMFPTTFPGYAIAVIVMLAGLITTSLPIAIIGGNFTVVYEYNQKRKRIQKKQKN